jgi:hypothetical protein
VGTYFIPDILSEFSCLPHTPSTGTGTHFALVGVTNGIGQWAAGRERSSGPQGLQAPIQGKPCE